MEKWICKCAHWIEILEICVYTINIYQSSFYYFLFYHTSTNILVYYLIFTGTSLLSTKNKRIPKN